MTERLGDHNLARLAEARFERHGDYESLCFEGRWHRSGELFERARAAGGGLAELGVEPGDRVVVMMANCPEVGVALPGALARRRRASRPAMFLLPPEELRHVLADAEATRGDHHARSSSTRSARPRDGRRHACAS